MLDFIYNWAIISGITLSLSLAVRARLRWPELFRIDLSRDVIPFPLALALSALFRSIDLALVLFLQYQILTEKILALFVQTTKPAERRYRELKDHYEKDQSYRNLQSQEPKHRRAERLNQQHDDPANNRVDEWPQPPFKEPHGWMIE
jgi:hypothetical protein